jgi:hypothetical protein
MHRSIGLDSRYASETMTGDVRIGPQQSLVATYADSAGARRALAALRAAGVSDDAISFVGEFGGTAPNDASLVGEDRSVIMRIFWAGLIWGGVGAVLGAAIGYVLARIGFPTDNVAIQVASWAMFTHIAATLWAAYAVIYEGTPRSTPGRPSPGAAQTMIVVRSADAATLSLAEDALTQSGALVVRRA